MKPRQHRLVIEQFELAGGAAHMQIDHPFDLRLDLRRQDRQRGGRIARQVERVARGGHCVIHVKRAKTAHAPAKKLAAGLRLDLRLDLRELDGRLDVLAHGITVSARRRG